MEMALLAKVTRTTRHKGGFAPPARSTSRWASASGAMEASSAAKAAPPPPPPPEAADRRSQPLEQVVLPEDEYRQETEGGDLESHAEPQTAPSPATSAATLRLAARRTQLASPRMISGSAHRSRNRPPTR